MKVFIPSYDRPRSITTPGLMPTAIDWKVVLHNDFQLKQYASNLTLPPGRLIVSDVPISPARIRNWILDQVPEGEWCMMLDDNITAFRGVLMPAHESDPLQLTGSGKILNSDLSGFGFYQRAVQLTREADSIGAHYCGFSMVSNPMFRLKNYKEFGFVIGKGILIKKTDLRFDDRLLDSEDLDFTAQNLERFGKILINNWIEVIKIHKNPGGCGTLEERTPNMIHASALIMEKWPGLFKYAEVENRAPGSVLKFAIDRRKLEAWRSSRPVA